jgi:hypothetical protein
VNEDQQKGIDLENDKFLASAIHYLFQLGQKEAANLLLTCNLESKYIEEIYYEGDDYSRWALLLRGSPIFYKTFYQYKDVSYNSVPPDALNSLVEEAFEAVLPPPERIKVTVRIDFVDVDTDWRTRLLAESETQQVSNQNPFGKTTLVWQGIKFDSEGEVKIAQELDSRGIMYLPVCLARVGSPKNRQNRIPDFLICHKGKWGILEVDGQTYHTPTNATADHDRRRVFEQHGGISYFDRFPYKRCINEPGRVVDEFLGILANK